MSKAYTSVLPENTTVVYVLLESLANSVLRPCVLDEDRGELKSSSTLIRTKVPALTELFQYKVYVKCATFLLLRPYYIHTSAVSLHAPITLTKCIV